MIQTQKTGLIFFHGQTKCFKQPQQIVRLEAESNYTRVYFIDHAPILMAKVLLDYENILRPYGFVRTHKSHLVNTQYVTAIDQSGMVQMRDASRVGISRRKKRDVLLSLLSSMSISQNHLAMKILYCLILMCFACTITFGQGSVGVGTNTPHESSALEVSSVTQGVLVPRMTTAQRTSISSPATGLLVFDVSTNSFWFKGSSQWIQLIDSSTLVVHSSGSNIYMGMDGNVGIGTSSPTSKLEVKTAPDGDGIKHTDGIVTMLTRVGSGSARISTTTNHQLQLSANNFANHFTLATNGNVGIGTNAPSSRFEVRTASDANGISHSDGNITIMTKVGSGIANFSTTTNHPLHISANNNVNQLVAATNGFVGIGMATPGIPLNFAPEAGNKISLSGNSGAHYGFGIAANLMQLYTPGSGAAIGFGYGSSAAFTENMRLTGDGKLGIGTNAPSEKLHVQGNAHFSGSVNIVAGLAVGGAIAVGGAAAFAGGGSFGGSVGMGTTTPDPSSALDISSTSKGFLPPRMTTNEREAIDTPAEGLVVYDTSTDSPWYNDGNEWKDMDPDETSMDTFDHEVFRYDTDRIYMGLNDSVGVGTYLPEYKLHVLTGNNQDGIAHTNGNVEIATHVSNSAGGSIGTVSDHPFSLYAGNGNSQLTVFENGNVEIENKLGIGTFEPHAPLQFNNDDLTKTIVMRELLNGLDEPDENQYTGFGSSSSMLRYQVYDDFADHVFYAGHLENNVSSSHELMRIKGNGKLGIGLDPVNHVDIASETRTQSHPNNLMMYVTGNMNDAAAGVEFRKSDASEGIGFGSNTIYAAGSNVSQNLNFTAKGGTGAIQLSTNNLQRIFISGNGNVGIGTITPNASLQLGNTLSNRRFVLWESFNNDHQFYGLGINGNTLRYQVSGTGDNHIFYAGASASTSNELMRISGSGNVGIGVSSPLATLEVARGSGNNGTAMFKGTTYASHFNYSTDENTVIRGGKANAHVIFNDIAGLGNVAIGTGTPLQKLHVEGSTYISQKVGIGIPTPNAPLQFPNTTESRKIVLWENGNNDHQFYGLGINSYTMRYQVSGPSDNHIFYAGTSSSSSTELMRIAGSGNVGIGVTSPSNRIDIHSGGEARNGTHPTDRPMYVTGSISDASNGIEFRHANGSQGIGFGFNTIYATGNNPDQDLGLAARGTYGSLVFSTNGSERMRVTGSGNIGIGTSYPNGALQFSNDNQLRKVVLHEFANNDHEFSGFGYAGGELRYQTGNIEFDHVFYGATSASTSNELMRVRGTGNVEVAGSIEIGYVIVQNSTDVSPGSTTTMTCDCPQGSKVLGGGWNGPSLDTIQSRPSSQGTAWIVTSNNLDPFNSHVLQMWAICARLAN